MLKEHSFARGDLRLNYAEGPPSGPPMLLLHGGGSSGWQGFLPLIPGLLARYHLHALDLRGHGKSRWTPGHYRDTDFAGDVVAFVEQNVGKPTILFGHSLGGRIALLAATQRPDLVSAVITADTPLSNASLRSRIEATREEALRRNAVRERPHDPDFYWSLQGQFDDTFGSWHSSAILSAIEAPALILQADPSCGGVLTDGEVRDALGHLRDGDHAQFPGQDHSLWDGSPEEVVDTIFSFLATRGL